MTSEPKGKRVKDLASNDRVKMADGQIGVVQDLTRDRLFQAEGGCWLVKVKVGKETLQEWYPGAEMVELAD